MKISKKVEVNYSDKVLKIMLEIYIFSLPWTFAESMYDGRLTASIIISSFMLIYLTLKALQEIPVCPISDIFFLLFCFIVILAFSMLVNLVNESKQFNHFFAYFVSILFFGYVPMMSTTFIANKYDMLFFFRDLAYVGRLSCLVAILEFIGANYFSIFPEDILFFPDTIEAKSLFLGAYYRSRGLAAEPGHYALVLEFLSPFIFFFNSLSNSYTKIWHIFDFALVVLALISTGSPAGISILVACFIVSLLLSNFGDINVNYFIFFLICIILGIVIIIAMRSDNQLDIINIVTSLFEDKANSKSADARFIRFEMAKYLTDKADIVRTLIGYGPAISDTLNLMDATIIQLYFLVLLESGIIGFIAFFGSFVLLASVVFQKIKIGKMFLFWSMTSCFAHYLLIANYYYPYIWFLYAIVVSMLAINNTKTIISRI